MARSIDKKHDALVVEGPDDQAFVNEWVKKGRGLDLRWAPGGGLVKSAQGAVGAFTLFDQLRKEAVAGTRLALIVDRDGIEGREDNWPKVQSRVDPRPEKPSPDGFVFEYKTRGARVGIWMWPDGVSLGDLEVLVGRLLPPDPAWNWAKVATNTARLSHGAEFDLADQRKAELKVRSSWLSPPQGGYGHLIRRLDLTDDPAAQAFLSWFERLFLAE